MKVKNNNNVRTLNAKTAGTIAKKRKAKGPRPSVFMMVFYWILALLLGLAAYFKGRHFLVSHWNKSEVKTNTGNTTPNKK